jgi:hypothetical protein
MKENRGIIHQMEYPKPLKYSKPRGITKRDIFLVAMFIYGKNIHYTENLIREEEDLDIALNHYNLIRQWKL